MVNGNINEKLPELVTVISQINIKLFIQVQFSSFFLRLRIELQLELQASNRAPA